jgi:hypothetical protein
MHDENIDTHAPDRQRMRSDNASASIIEHALVVQSCHGTYYAARLLHNKGISLATALRLLTRPALQRRSQQAALLAPRMYGSVPSMTYRHTWA